MGSNPTATASNTPLDCGNAGQGGVCVWPVQHGGATESQCATPRPCRRARTIAPSDLGKWLAWALLLGAPYGLRPPGRGARVRVGIIVDGDGDGEERGSAVAGGTGADQQR
ncbi:hypothetical protein SSP35_05_04790 [Streptomyces sp. NBRC 110611]|nr:hypothetical protein SSP35_05_04790 [Streptomyces sp. NBRC 110611]